MAGNAARGSANLPRASELALIALASARTAGGDGGGLLGEHRASMGDRRRREVVATHE